jgi:hypothetical protein
MDDPADGWTMTDTLEDFITGNEEAAQRMLIAGDAEFAQQALEHWSALRKLMTIGAEFSARQSEAALARKGANLSRDVKILAEYEKRLQNRDNFRTGKSNMEIAIEVGRLYRLRKGGVLSAIRRARAHRSGRRFTLPGIAD